MHIRSPINKVIKRDPTRISLAAPRHPSNVRQPEKFDDLRRLEEDRSPKQAKAYSDALAVGTLDPERSDVLSKIRKDFDAAGVVQSEEQILSVMNELTLQAGNQMPGTQGGGTDALAVMLAQKLKSQ